ncbi:hypothetical protein ACN28S_25020 [Cystobacter fuscus]
MALSAAPPNTSGMKPELSFWNPVEKGPTDRPPSSASCNPRKTSMPASVTMNEGTRM